MSFAVGELRDIVLLFILGDIKKNGGNKNYAGFRRLYAWFVWLPFNEDNQWMIETCE